MPVELKSRESAVLEKTRELCEAIVAQPHFSRLVGDVERFLADGPARSLYEALIEKQHFLMDKQERGHELTDEEVADFEKEREDLLSNPLASAFLEARDHIQRVQGSISQYVSKTFELGRVPSEADLSRGGCCGGGGGGGCGCGGR